MHYVKHFDINGVDTKQVACIELHGKPNATTEGCVGVLGIDVDSPTHDVYKCVAVNGAIYTWELLSSGMSIISAAISGEGAESVQFPYIHLRTPAMYVVKVGDLVLDKEGYLYQINSINSTYCEATYCNTQGLQSMPAVPEAWTFTLKDSSTVKKFIYVKNVPIVPVTIEIVNHTISGLDPTFSFSHNGQYMSVGGDKTFDARTGDTLGFYINSGNGYTVTINGVVVKETWTMEPSTISYEYPIASDVLIEFRHDNYHRYITITER